MPGSNRIESRVMSRFLFTTWPFPGHVIPHVTIAQALIGHGHECAFYTGSRAGKVLNTEGIRHFPFRRLNEDELWKLLFEEQSGFIHWRDFSRFQGLMRSWLLETLSSQVEDLLPILEEWKPDAIVCDPTMWGPILVLHEKYRIPVAVSCYFACKVPGPDMPPFGLGLPLPKHAWDRSLYRLIAKSVDFASRGFRQRANDIRQSFGLPPIQVPVSAFAGTMPLYMVPCSPEFDYNRRNLPKSVHYIGPLLWKAREESSAADFSILRSDRPWIHITEGTIHVQAPLVLSAAARGLADLPMEVIMTTGGNREPSELEIGPLASNVHLYRWVSHSELLPRIAVLVTTGGAGSVLAALNAGVPMVVVPTEWDKPEVAQRVVESGAGIRLSPKKCTPANLRDAVEKILQESSFRENARRLQASFSGLGGPSQAVHLLEGLVVEHRSPREYVSL
jgi:MGT family glycosyltransferase